MTQQAAEAVVAGHICLDIIPGIQEKKNGLGTFLVPGKLIEVGPARASTGGTVPNTGLALHLLGLKTRLMGKIGRDLFGSEILHALGRYGDELTEGMIVSPEEDTSYTLVINPPNVDRIFLHCTGANDTFTVDDIQQQLLEGARLFHFGYPPLMRRMYEEDGKELERLLATAKARGMTVSLDMAKPDPESPAGLADWRTILTRAIPHVDIFLPSFEELLYMLRPESYKQLSLECETEDLLPYASGTLLSSLAGELLDMGAAAVAFKLGEHGLYLRTTADPARLQSMGACSPTSDMADNWLDRELLAPCYKVSPVGTTGAGDATIAGFLAALLKGMPVEDSLLSAVGTGAFSVEQADAVSGIPSWTALTERISSGWPQLENRLDLTGWHYNERLKVWSK
ncbi:carbohydrate kinase family protein [Cohnella cholangitidis]|uniref:Carbohydrate kinase family protein n=1 Tax=Cohnella cholangitidis TaxID=2598458 RepID=A0A7G5C0K1_9BACL|nr:carbohydrate kinase family protein [Cohnella cholangitidis]QMV42735.1 carbohydrate kinase family protein [Cohnella cholangitidis]